MPIPVKLPDELVQAARRAGNVEQRSGPEQIVHWANLGRRFAHRFSTSLLKIEAVQKGELQFDDLSDDEKELYLDKTLTASSSLSFDPRRTGKKRVAWLNNGETPVELRPDGTAWAGHLDEEMNFVSGKQIAWPNSA